MVQSTNSADFAILFVDDEEMARKYFVRAYSADFYILTADCVDSAKEVLAKHSDEIGVLITDQRMPGDPGVVLLDYVRQRYPHIVRLLTTAYSDLDDAIKAVNSGEILRYIVKPWDIDSLRTELRNALRFFYLQNERDQLLREKLSVWQRMTEVNRVRDLLVMAGSMNHLHRPLDAIRLMLMQVPVTVELFSEERSLEMWGLMEDEVRNMLALSGTIIAETQGCLADDTKVSIVDQLQTIASRRPQTRLTVSNDVPSPDVPSAAIEKTLECMLHFLENAPATSHQSFSMSAKQKANTLVITLSASNSESEPVFGATVDLIVAFMLIAHCGGTIKLVKGNDFGAEVVVPLDQGESVIPQANEHWLDEVFSLYES
ncbi:MAG: response regulator [Pseudomonadota bacterium]